MDFTLVIFDTETTSLRGAPHLLELGAVRVAQGEIVDRFEALVRAEVPIEPEASDFHGITPEMVSEAEPVSAVLERFAAWAGEDALAAHRAEVDGRVIAFECARANVRPPSGWLIDTLRLSRKLMPEAPDHKLTTLCEFLELEEGVHHRALADAVWCWKVLEACCDRMDPRPASVAELVQAAGAPSTIAACAPRVRGLLKSRHRALERACRLHEQVTLVYGDGRTSPVPLPVLPRVLFCMGERSYLEAECVASGTIKTYRLDRVHKVMASS